MKNSANINDMQNVQIYKISNLINGKLYIGQTSKLLADRFNQHKSASKRHNNPFHKAIRKYGIDNFKIETVLICNHDMANFYENLVMDFYKSHISLGNGYNVASPLNHFHSISGLKGEKHHQSKLTNDDVINIRASVDVSSREFAKKYNVSKSTVNTIRKGTGWSHIKDDIHKAYEYYKYSPCGENHHNAIFSDDVRLSIKNDNHTNTSDLAKQHNTTCDVIGSIRGSKPHISKKRIINDEVAQYVLDNPDITNSKLSELLNISMATISRIKTKKQFSHLTSHATHEKWDIYYNRNTRL